jgi:phosphoglycolate phosphatase
VTTAVIFDLDGTLLDTIEDIAGAMNAILEGRGLPPHDIEAYKTLVGDGIEAMVHRALAPNPPGDDEVARIIRDYRKAYDLAWRDHSRPFPGIPGLLASLARRGVKTAVLSNKSDVFTQAMVSELLAGFRFDVVRGSLPGVALKPDPAPALAIAADLGVRPADCLFLGDTNVDMRTAVAAGMRPIGALWGFRTARELRESGAAALIASPAELLACL